MICLELKILLNLLKVNEKLKVSKQNLIFNIEYIKFFHAYTPHTYEVHA